MQLSQFAGGNNTTVLLVKLLYKGRFLYFPLLYFYIRTKITLIRSLSSVAINFCSYCSGFLCGFTVLYYPYFGCLVLISDFQCFYCRRAGTLLGNVRRNFSDDASEI